VLAILPLPDFLASVDSGPEKEEIWVLLRVVGDKFLVVGLGESEAVVEPVEKLGLDCEVFAEMDRFLAD
jgi:hypothetical protein